MTRAVAVRLGAFAGLLALAFVAAFTLGATVDPIAAADQPEQADAPAGHDSGQGMSDEAGHSSELSAGAPLPGLAVSEAGYTLVPTTTFFTAGREELLRFTVRGPDGRPVTAYDRTHEKDLHLIVVRRDLSGFRHVHPTRDAAGTWSTPFTFGSGGTWRVFADFAPAGLNRTITLGTDVNVAGTYVPVRLPEASNVTSVDGYDVTLAGTPVAGEEAELAFRISQAGKAVSDLQPYLGAYGHLVSLRVGDLAYLHNHPAELAQAGSRGGPEVRFGTTFPTAGTYRLFLDFQHAGAVHTAEFTVKVDAHGNRLSAPPASSTSTAHGN
jgi:hypothetical protein